MLSPILTSLLLIFIMVILYKQLKIPESTVKEPINIDWSDQPIKRREEDLLGLAPFADAITSVILSRGHEKGLVLALYGEWGSGKTSITNLIKESLKVSKVKVISFNPWQWSGETYLARAFCDSIGQAIGSEQNIKQRKDIERKWFKYTKFFLSAPILSIFYRILMVFLGTTAICGAIVTSQIWIKTILGIVGIMANTIGTVSTTYENRISFLTRLRNDVDSISFAQKDLNNALKDLEGSILVIIDDIDRLSPDEIKLLFKLVKSNSNFNNLAFLLCMSRDIVVSALETYLPKGTGSSYLDKIVLLGFDMPLPDPKKIDEILLNELNKLLGDIEIRDSDLYRWSMAYPEGVRPYFVSLRSIKRYLSMLAVYVNLLSTFEGIEVNPVDLMLIEVLRVFEPELHKELSLHKAALLGSKNEELFDNANQRQKDDSEEIKKMLMIVSEYRREYVTDILKQLFPYVNKILSLYSDSRTDRFEWFREKRICHKDVFDRYFRIVPSKNDIPHSFLYQILDSINKRDWLVSHFKELKHGGLLMMVLERLEAFTDTIDLKSAETYITSLFDIGDDLPDIQSGIIEIRPDMQLIRLVYWLLKREIHEEKRAQTLIGAIKSTNGLYIPVRIGFLYSGKTKEKEDQVFVSDENLISFREACVDNIIQASRDGRLKKASGIDLILQAWYEWGNKDQVIDWVHRLVANQEGFVSFLIGHLSKSTEYGIGLPIEKYRIHLPNIEPYIGINELQEKVNRIDVASLDEKGRRAITALKRALRKREQSLDENALDLDDWQPDEIGLNMDH